VSKQLLTWLENEEKSLRGQFSLRPNPSGASTRCNSNTQFYATEKKYGDEDSEIHTKNVVLAIGSNFTQDPYTSLPSIYDNLTQWHNNARHAMKVLDPSNSGKQSWHAAWINHQWLSTPVLPFHAEDDHMFIMTNWCPWITQVKWTDLDKHSGPGTSDGLLKASQTNGVFTHIMDLLKYLNGNGYKTIIILHGLEPILNHSRTYSAKLTNWFLYANLTYKRTPTKWDTSLNRFVFKLG
jgi:hypothetical protein